MLSLLHFCCLIYLFTVDENNIFYVGDIFIRYLSHLQERLKRAVERIEALEDENKRLKRDLLRAKKDLANVKTLSRRQRQAYQRQAQKMDKVQKEEVVREALSPFFTDTQISCYLRGDWQRVRKWNQADISLALTIRLLHKKTYTFLRDSKILPLPGLSTLESYFRNFDIPEGFLTSVVRLISVKAQTMTPRERLASLSFDEMHVKSDVNYDRRHDQVVGPFSGVNVFLLRGICGHWKLPVYYSFNMKSVPKETFLEVIKKVEEAGVHIVSVCCDGAAANRSLAKKLGVTIDQPWFPNPANPGAMIVWIPDPPHVLKLLRNRLIEEGIVLPSGLQVGKDALLELFDNVDTEVSTNFKLTRKHIEVKDQEKQRVYLAAQLLSHRTAEALRQVFPADNEKKEFASFIDIIDGWFDTMNSRLQYTYKDLRCGFSVKIEKQKAALMKAKAIVQDLRVCGQADMMPWQKSLVMGINAVFQLYSYLKDDFGVFYIKTSRLNQDGVENLFSRIRAMGGNSHKPGALEFRQRFRLFLLGGCNKMAVKNTAVLCQQDSDDQLLTAEVSRDFASMLEEDPDLQEVDEILDFFDESSSTTTTTAKNWSWSETEGMRYFGGYLAKSCHQDCLFRTSQDSAKDPNKFVESKWLQGLYESGTGLAHPSKDFEQDLHLMEYSFEWYQLPSSGLRRSQGYLSGLLELLAGSFPQYSRDLLRKYALGRTKMRMRDIEENLPSKKKENLRSVIKKLEQQH